MPDPAPSFVRPPVLRVSDLNRAVKELVESRMALVWVAGEISNFKRYDSGHCYFTLKDDAAQVDCVMFRHKVQYLDWRPDNGIQVEVRACPTVYEARGKFQLNVDIMRRAGLGALFEAFERLKARLEREGLFDPERKRPLPALPRAVGVVTSREAAALRDVLTVLRRRMPSVPVIVYPTPVQGEGAAAKIAQAIELAGSRAECDVLIVCRGGGSIEDLWAYNEEVLARAIVASPIPVVSGVGHETDFTIADFVADVRAPTPTAAAQLVVPDRAELRQTLEHWRQRLCRMAWRGLEDRMQRVDYLSRRLVHPGERINARMQHLDHLYTRLCSSWRRIHEGNVWNVKHLGQQLHSSRPDVDAAAQAVAEAARRLRQAASHRTQQATVRVESLQQHLEHLNPQRVLERGYSIVQTASGTVVRRAATLQPGDPLRLTFADGEAEAEVKSAR